MLEAATACELLFYWSDPTQPLTRPMYPPRALVFYLQHPRASYNVYNPCSVDDMLASGIARDDIDFMERKAKEEEEKRTSYFSVAFPDNSRRMIAVTRG